MRELGTPERDDFCERAAGRWMLRSSSPGSKIFEWSPVTKSAARTSRGAPSRGQSVYVPSSATVSEIIGPAGSDITMFPPIVASFQILNDERKIGSIRR